MNFLKLLGYMFLIFGFAAVNLRPHPGGGVIKAICLQQLNTLSQQETNNRTDILPAMVRAANSAWEIGSNPPIGGALIMLAGGVLIDIGARQVRFRKKQPAAMPDHFQTG